jgi:hypothetical protein
LLKYDYLVAEMSKYEKFLDLSPAERAALLYVVGCWTQKDLFNRYRVSYSEFSLARKELVGKGILTTENVASQEGFGLIPIEAWTEIRSSLHAQLELSREETRVAYADNLRNKENITALNTRIESLLSNIAEQKGLLEKNRDLNDVLGSFANMGINAQWVRSIVALALMEAAMKKKLEQLGMTVQQNISFGELRNILEQAINDKEKRKLRPRLLGLSELSQMRNKIIHTGHLYVDLPKSEADALVDNISNLISEILDFPGDIQTQK